MTRFPEARRRRRLWPLCLLALLAVTPLGIAGADGELVVFDRYSIAPRTVEVKAGAQVTFRVRKDETLVDTMRPLQIVADDGAFRTPPLLPGQEWAVNFPETGVFRYHVDEHRGVDGVVVVE
jgi:plastocyanin